MKLPSIVFIVSQAKRAALRFPLALISAAVAAWCAVRLFGAGAEREVLTRVLMTSQLGLPLLIALTLLAERKAADGKRSMHWWGGQVLGLTALVIYYFGLPSDIGPSAFTRFFQLNVGVHLLVAFAPYLGLAETNGFWQFNKTLFLRLLTGAVFSATLFLGLTIAILALDQLFNVPVDEEIYPRLWVLVVFVFNSWYFLAGIPTDRSGLAASRDYPRVIKIFAQYILAPLVAVYMSLLLAYLVKVLITTQWPSGWIGYLVSSVAAAGLFSLVLLHPLVEEAENRWINSYARLFNVLLLPALVMLMLAIYKRVAQYGITENRYFLSVLAFWLVFVALHGLLARKRTIKIIPVTLCLVAFLTSFGPWGAFGVARSSQTKRLSRLLEANSLLVEGRMVPAQSDVGFEDRKEMSAILDYLIEHHGYESVSLWFDDTLTTEVAQRADSLAGNYRNHVPATSTIMDYLGVDYVESWAQRERSEYRFYQYTREVRGESFDIAGYEKAYLFEVPSAEENGFEIDGVSYTIIPSENDAGITIKASGEKVLDLGLLPVMEGLREYSREHGVFNTAPGALLTAEAIGESLHARLVILEIQWDNTGTVIKSRFIKALMLVNTVL